MHVDWAPLRAELAACRHDGITVPFWWRDDDAVAPTPALDTLSALVEHTGLAVHLAIIPAHATDGLAEYVDGTQMIPLVHGWAHHDHSGPGEKKNEFMTRRPNMGEETARGLARMQTLFGAQLRRMFVPPWNRVDRGLLPTLSAQGYVALSTFGARRKQEAAPGLAQINTHIDPIRWKGNRDLVAPADLVATTVAYLRARRQGDEDAGEPLGLLTHHLVHTPAIWTFTQHFIHEMLSGGALPWTMETT